MMVTGLSFETFAQITRVVSAALYDGNVIVAPDNTQLSGTRFRGRLMVASSRGSGARRSWTGRRIPAACWHAYRDVLAAVFAAYPDARVRTGMAVYRGAAGFAASYPDTAYVNIGSQVMPAYMPELCECNGNDPMSPAEYRALFEARLGAFYADLFAGIRSADSSTPDALHVPAAGPAPDALVFGPAN